MEAPTLEPPDLVGAPWAEAEPLLSARGLTYRTVITAPPGKPVGTGELRVVGQRQEGDTVVLILAHRAYGTVQHDASCGPGGAQ